MASFGWWVALGIANLVDLFDPDMVVIGGGLVGAGDLVMDPIRAAYRGEAYGAAAPATGADRPGRAGRAGRCRRRRAAGGRAGLSGRGPAGQPGPDRNSGIGV